LCRLTTRLEGRFGENDAPGDLDQFGAMSASQVLQEVEGGRLIQLALLHNDALRTLDNLPILERLAHVVDLRPQSLHFLKPLHGHGNCRRQVVLADRLDEVGNCSAVVGSLNKVFVAMAGNDDHRHFELLEELFGDLQTINPGHLNIGNDQVRPRRLTMLNQFFSRLGFQDNLVPGARKCVSQEDAIDLVVVRKRDPVHTAHVSAPHVLWLKRT
jgi:hypothetical protein